MLTSSSDTVFLCAGMISTHPKYGALFKNFGKNNVQLLNAFVFPVHFNQSGSVTTSML